MALFGVVKAKTLRKIDVARAPASYYLGVLGMPGITAWFGLTEIGKPKAGEGMLVFDWADRYGEAIEALSGYLAAGKLEYRESIVEGLDSAPRGLIGLLKGENFGKQLVKLA